MHFSQLNRSQIKGIVFDLDDTLYPQASFKRSGFRVVSRWVSDNCNLNESNVMSMLKMIMKEKGPSYPYMLDSLVERLNLDQGLVSDMMRVFIEHEPQIDCFDGVLEMLDRLRKRYLLGILTDGRLSVQQKKIRNLGLDKSVDAILCSDSMKLEKPAPELYQWFENEFNAIGVNMMYVGDNPLKDFSGAENRGWITVMVMTGEHQPINPKYLLVPRNKIPHIIELEKFMTQPKSVQKTWQP